MRRIQKVASHVTPEPCRGQGKGEVVVTLIAAGNSGHVCAALIDGNTQGRVKGLLYRVSRNPAELIPNSDIVLWTGPVTSTKERDPKLQPYFDARRTCIGTIFAQGPDVLGLVHVSAQRIFGPHVRFFALRNIPWLCRVVKAGEESAISGAKSAIGVMTCNLSEEWVKRELEPLFVVQKCGKREPTLELLPDFCPVVFNPANQIIHPARYWAMFRNWRGVPLSKEEEPPEWLYRDMDETAGQVLVVLDEDLQALKDAYYQATGAEGCHHVIPLATRLLEQYGDQIADQSTMAKMVGTNKAYSMARTPVLRTMQGVMPHPNHRVVTDDIGWGLCVLVSIAERLQDFGVQTPTTMMRMLIEWHQKIMKKEPYLYNGRLRGRDCAELVLLGPGDELSMVAKGVESESGGDWISKADGQAETVGNRRGRETAGGRFAKPPLLSLRLHEPRTFRELFPLVLEARLRASFWGSEVGRILRMINSLFGWNGGGAIRTRRCSSDAEAQHQLAALCKDSMGQGMSAGRSCKGQETK
eukprot:g806.t1